jgi:hypothetical protein
MCFLIPNPIIWSSWRTADQGWGGGLVLVKVTEGRSKANICFPGGSLATKKMKWWAAYIQFLLQRHHEAPLDSGRGPEWLEQIPPRKGSIRNGKLVFLSRTVFLSFLFYWGFCILHAWNWAVHQNSPAWPWPFEAREINTRVCSWIYVSLLGSNTDLTLRQLRNG